MRCDEFLDRWQRLLDERQMPEEDYLLKAHAEECEECDGILQTQTVLFSELARFGPTLAPTPEPISRDFVSPRGAAPSRVSRTTAWIVAGAVAASLLALLIPQAVRFDRLRRNSTRLASVGEGPLGHAALTVRGPVSETDHGRTNNKTSSKPADPEVIHRLMQNMAASLSDTPEEPSDPLDPIAGGLKPISNTLGAAWNALLRSIPVKDDQLVPDPQAVIDWARLPNQA